MHGRHNFLPVDIHKAALWEQKPLKLLIVLWLLLWQPEANSLCRDWHAFLLWISCHEYSNAFCALAASCSASDSSGLPLPPPPFPQPRCPSQPRDRRTWDRSRRLGGQIAPDSERNALYSHLWAGEPASKYLLSARGVHSSVPGPLWGTASSDKCPQ